MPITNLFTLRLQKISHCWWDILHRYFNFEIMFNIHGGVLYRYILIAQGKFLFNDIERCHQKFLKNSRKIHYQVLVFISLSLYSKSSWENLPDIARWCDRNAAEYDRDVIECVRNLLLVLRFTSLSLYSESSGKISAQLHFMMYSNVIEMLSNVIEKSGDPVIDC